MGRASAPRSHCRRCRPSGPSCRSSPQAPATRAQHKRRPPVEGAPPQRGCVRECLCLCLEHH
eukprot:6202814-Pleurochrysis_carterae.AAC.3